jgi:hypothetical protein
VEKPIYQFLPNISGYEAAKMSRATSKVSFLFAGGDACGLASGANSEIHKSESGASLLINPNISVPYDLPLLRYRLSLDIGTLRHEIGVCVCQRISHTLVLERRRRMGGFVVLIRVRNCDQVRCRTVPPKWQKASRLSPDFSVPDFCPRFLSPISPEIPSPLANRAGELGSVANRGI